MLITGMNIKDIEGICIRVEMDALVYPLCFILEETDNELVVASTGDDGAERIVIINKAKIVSVNVVYQQDIDAIFESDGEENAMFE